MIPLAKPYSAVRIRECGEPLDAIPPGLFALFDPHPYVARGAPYGAASPWMLRRSILDSLRKAQADLQRAHPGWKIKLFDAYRPNAVQAFMVDHELTMLAQNEGLSFVTLRPDERERLMEKVYRIFAIPSDDPARPPPHSTGAAFDCTLADEEGREIDMGSPVDENSDRSLPDYFAEATDVGGRRAHANRALLCDIMERHGLRRHPGEWWHFSRGDQLAVWNTPGRSAEDFAIYGRADLL